MALCLEPSIDRTAAQTGIWTPAEEERRSVEEAVEKFHGKNWDAIAEIVPGRTERNSVRVDGDTSWTPVSYWSVARNQDLYI
jgi:hypothetical protein